MSSLPKWVPEPDKGGAQAERATDERDATAVLTPPPSGAPPSGEVRPSDAPTMVDARLETGVPLSASDAPTLHDAGPSRPPTSPQNLSSSDRMLPPGTVLGGRYEIVSLLGEGGMGAVYKAIDHELNLPVALKVIRPEYARQKAIIDRFKQELLLAREVTHRNVIRIYDLGEADRIKFITMEYVEGEDLRSLLLRKKKLSPEEAIDIIQQVCRALEAAHNAGIIHRDLKPQNIMQDRSGRILVMDFGLARLVGSDGMTQTGALVGTMDYMSPEQALGKSLDQRSDLYTVGLIFYELLTGKMPFADDSALASLIKRTQQRAAPVLDSEKSIPQSINNIVAKCLERDLNARYQSAGELLADLEAWQGKRAGAALTFHANVGPWARTLPWPLIATVVTVIVLAIGAWLMRGRLFGTSGAAGPQVSLAILPFRNASGDPSLDWMGSTVSEMLRSDMGQSASFRTVPSDRVNQVMHDLRLGPDANLDPDTLRRIAELTNADRIVGGQYVKLGDQVRIDATLRDLKRQRNFSMNTAAPNEKDLLPALQQLADAIEKNLAMSNTDIQSAKAEALKPSTQSITALRYYNEGLQLARQGKNLDAAKKFEAATQEDPNFALAFSKLGATYAVLGYGDKAEETSRKAAELSDKISPQERELILAEEARVTKDYGRAIEAYQQLAKILPNDSDVRYALAQLYDDSGSQDKARPEYEKLLARDPNNVDLLLHMGILENRRGNPQGALDYLNRALNITITVDNEEERATVLEAIGNAYEQMNKPKEALRNYQDVLESRQRLHDKPGVARALGWMAEVQQKMGQTEEARKSLDEALKLRREIGDKQGLGQALIDVGGFDESIGRYDAALDATKEALATFRQLGERQSEAICLNNIGWFYLDKADYEDALAYSQQALQIRQAINSPADIAETTYNVGEIYVRMGQYSQGMDNYLKALDLWRKSNDKRGVAFASYGLGRVFQYQGRYGAAMSAETDALQNWRETNDRGYWLPEIQGSYGNVLMLMGRSDEAQRNLDEALALARELKNESVTAQVLNFQGDRAFFNGDFKAAQSLFEQAAQAAVRGSDREQALVAKVNVAKVAVENGHSRDQVRVLQDLSDQTAKMGLQYLSVEASLYLGKALIDSKDYGRAVQLADRGIRESDRLGLQTSLARSQFLKAEALRLSGKQAESTHYYSQAHSILDGIGKEAKGGDPLKRRDLANIYQESARWQSPAS